MYCLSVLRFRGQRALPDPRLLRVESATNASLRSAPMNAITPAALSAMRTCRSPMSVRTFSDVCRAASTRLALRSDVLDSIRDRIAQAFDDDDTLLAARTPGWLADCLLSFVLRLRAQAVRLPESIALHPRPELLFSVGIS